MTLQPSSVPEPVRLVCRVIREHGARAWIVGGCVRDTLLGRPVNDWDIATDARPDQVQQWFRRVLLTGVAHGTVTVMLKGHGYEVTTLRGDGTYSDGRHPDEVTFVDDLREDLARRDFTVNAMAYDPFEDVLSDPFDGRKDLQRGVIRAVGDPKRRFSEDSLRLMRAVRFSATLGFRIEPTTWCAIAETADGIRRVSLERIADELGKMLLAPKPSVGLSTLRYTGLLEHVLPELVPTIGCQQNAYHAYDVWEHTLSCVDAVRPEAVLRWAALLHDVAKPRVRGRNEKTGDYTFYGHEKEGAVMARAMLRRLRMSNSVRDEVAALVRYHLVDFDDNWTDAAVRRWIRRVEPQRVEAVLELAQADSVAKGKPGELHERLNVLQRLADRVARVHEQKAAFSIRDLAVKGGELIEQLGLKPGPIVGETMRHLLELVLDDPGLNQREILFDKAKQFVSSRQHGG